MTRPGADVDRLLLEFQLALAGRFAIERELGRGGMGIVYLAREVQLDRLVAIKLLPPERALDDDQRERFLREARLAARLSHPHIIPIFAVDTVDQFVFYVMAYVEGENLGERVRQRGPIAAAEGTRILREVSWALGHAHANGLVHRDVKPENVLLESSSGRALVTDFGIAAAGESADLDSVAGTPEYMSPEQAMGGVVDARSDLYGLGATAYFIFTGRPPYTGSGAVEVLAQQVTAPVPVLGGTGVAVPRRLAGTIERCLAKSPDERPASAAVLADLLVGAADARREIPPALRAFVKREGRLSTGVFVGLSWIAMTTILPFGFLLGPISGVAIVLAGMVAIPGVLMSIAAHRLIRLGYDRRDLDAAFRHEAAELREEFLATGHRERTTAERRLGIVAASSAVGAIGFSAMTLIAPAESWALAMEQLSPIAMAVGVISLGARMILRSRRPQAAVEGWGKFWRGRAGKIAFALARLFGARPKVAAGTMTHRPTEIAIGMAAEELFASLPAASRSALSAVPALLTKLQSDATGLRDRLETLDRALEVGRTVESAEREPFVAHREEVARRLRDVTSTLESTRLNLLRLHAGALSVQGFTTHFEDAAGVSQDVRRLLEARGEVERFLQFPSVESRTPA